jgi:hypothetical protein
MLKRASENHGEYVRWSNIAEAELTCQNDDAQWGEIRPRLLSSAKLT